MCVQTSIKYKEEKYRIQNCMYNNCIKKSWDKDYICIGKKLKKIWQKTKLLSLGKIIINDFPLLHQEYYYFDTEDNRLIGDFKGENIYKVKIKTFKLNLQQTLNVRKIYNLK